MPSLNAAQHQAVQTLRGPLLVLAGAGTGKTRVVTYRIAELIRNGTAADRILAVTFTNKAAREMQQRTGEILGRRLKKRPEISTFHSLCVRVLRRHATRLGYPEKFAIYDRGDQESVARSALRQIKVPGEALRPGDLLSIISGWKSAGVSPAQAGGIAATDKEHLAAAAYRRYQRDLKAAGAVDFDDLLLLTEELFRTCTQARREEAGRFDHLLIDEYQDTNGSQYRIVRALAAGHRNLCVVGDDDQSIYAWRGAEVTHILNFRRDWPEAKVVRLEENYRSTAAILTLANRLIRFNSQRHDKILRPARSGGERPQILQFTDEEEEAAQVAADIQRRLSQPGIEPRDFAILFRTNEQPRALEMELRKANLPYILVGGMSFYDRKEVREVLAYLKVLNSPQDEAALLRIINRPSRGIARSAVEQITQQAIRLGEPVWDVLAKAERLPELSRLSKPARSGIDRLRTLVHRHQQLASKRPLVEVARCLLEEIGYRQEITRLYPSEAEQDARWAAVEELINSLARYEKRAGTPELGEFLQEVALAERDSADDKESQLRRNAIALMTLHSAKGLEFPQVYMVGMEEGILPHKRSIAAGNSSIDEERRLCYVGITRAQDRLTLSLALTRMKWGRPQESIPSRFLYEITGQADNAQDVARASSAKAGKPSRGGKQSRSSAGPKRGNVAKKTKGPKR